MELTYNKYFPLHVTNKINQFLRVMGKADKIRFKNTYKVLRKLWTKEYLSAEYERHKESQEIFLHQARCVKDGGDLLSLLREQIEQNLPVDEVYHIHTDDRANIRVRWGENRKTFLNQREDDQKRRRLRQEQFERDNETGCKFVLIVICFVLIGVFSLSILNRS